jgi:ankyrin repeat protein
LIIAILKLFFRTFQRTSLLANGVSPGGRKPRGPDRVHVLINRGERIDSQSSDRSTVLHRAADSQHEVVVRSLLENGANMNFINASNETVLHLATMHENILIVLLLIEGGADLDQKDVRF